MRVASLTIGSFLRETASTVVLTFPDAEVTGAALAVEPPAYFTYHAAT